MNYIKRNKINKDHIKGCCHVTEKFEWEDGEFIKILTGELPCVKDYASDTTKEKFDLFRKEYNTYNFYSTEPIGFLERLKQIVDEIQTVDRHWYGVNLLTVEETLKQHKFCLISGEGGIGKSYFVKCLEEELENKNIKHLCLYGKYEKEITDIDFKEICDIAERETFVFVFDAVNELDEINQNKLATELEKMKSIKGMRIVVTYREHSLSETILNLYISLAESTYRFPGISFESAVEWLTKLNVEDVSEYLDILYSNNPFLLSKLPYILNRKGRNNVSRYTHIYEQYIERSIDKPTWIETKKVASFMYDNNRKQITFEEISNIIDNPLDYISNMEQKGFLGEYAHEGQIEYYFVVESLADYLLARHLWAELEGKTIDECAEIIKEKTRRFYSMEEAVILAIFDKYAPDYKTVKEILQKSDLYTCLGKEVMQKIHVNKKDIDEFLKVFHPTDGMELLLYFGGYKSNPFNCVNFLNEYYKKYPSRQIEELSCALSRRFVGGYLKIRLKNMLYVTFRCDCDKDRILENFYTALWCCAAGNQDIRNLSIKLLYESTQRNEELIQELINIYPCIEDYYIQEAIIYVLSCCKKSNEICDFFEKRQKDADFLLAKSISRIDKYIGDNYGWINLEKENICIKGGAEISEDFKEMLSIIDLYEKYLLPFRFWSAEHVDMYNDFIFADKCEITEFNNRLNGDFACVKEGLCNGSMTFERKIEEIYGVSYYKANVGSKRILPALEEVLKNVLNKYNLPFKYDEIRKTSNDHFRSSIFRKCVCIAIDILYGSLMCNYFSDVFATYNNKRNSIGYEVFDPLEDGEDLHITTPLPIFQKDIEKMGDILLKKIDVSPKKNESWWNDLELTRKNVINLLTPIEYGGYQWSVVAARIFAKDRPDDAEWQDTYNIFCCTSRKEKFKEDGDERYLTIELEDYDKNIYDYSLCTNKPWLCKRVPSILYESSCFDEVNFFLPPAELISTLNLEFDITEMRWCDDNGDAIIICNNNKSSYYKDYAIGTVMMRKDVLDKARETMEIKYFVFSEKFIREKGYSPNTACHFEIIDGIITKEVLNYAKKRRKELTPKKCNACKYGFDVKDDVELGEELRKILLKYGK